MMNIRTVTTVITALLFFGLGLNQTPTVQAQSSTAKSLLDQVSIKYDNYNTLISAFTFQAKSASGETWTDAGSFKIEKASNKYYIKLTQQEMISDGRSTWTILPEEREVQISDVDPSSDALGPQNLFTFYKKGYRYATKGDEKVGSESLRVIELIPLESASNYTVLKLRINKNNHIHDLTIRDKNGAQYIYTIQSLYVNQQIPARTFTFNKASYKGYDLVDLR